MTDDTLDGLFWDYEHTDDTKQYGRIFCKPTRQIVAGKIDIHSCGRIVKRHNDTLQRLVEVKWQMLYKG